MKLRKSLAKPVMWQNISSCSVLSPEIVMHSCTTHLMLFSERLPIYASSCMTISGERTEQLDIFCHVTLALWVIFIRHKRPQMVTWQFLDRQFLDRHSNPNPDPNPDPDPNPNPIPNPVQELTVQELMVQEVTWYLRRYMRRAWWSRVKPVYYHPKYRSYQVVLPTFKMQNNDKLLLS